MASTLALTSVDALKEIPRLLTVTDALVVVLRYILALLLAHPLGYGDAFVYIKILRHIGAAGRCVVVRNVLAVLHVVVTRAISDALLLACLGNFDAAPAIVVAGLVVAAEAVAVVTTWLTPRLCVAGIAAVIPNRSIVRVDSIVLLGISVLAIPRAIRLLILPVVLLGTRILAIRPLPGHGLVPLRLGLAHLSILATLPLLMHLGIVNGLLSVIRVVARGSVHRIVVESALRVVVLLVVLRIAAVHIRSIVVLRAGGVPVGSKHHCTSSRPEPEIPLHNHLLSRIH